MPSGHGDATILSWAKCFCYLKILSAQQKLISAGRLLCPKLKEVGVSNFISCSPSKQINSGSISNEIFHYTRCITLKHVTSLRGPSSCHCTCSNTASFEEMLQRWQAIGNTVSDLTIPRFEPQTSCSRDKHITAQPAGQFRIC